MDTLFPPFEASSALDPATHGGGESYHLDGSGTEVFRYPQIGAILHHGAAYCLRVAPIDVARIFGDGNFEISSPAEVPPHLGRRGPHSLQMDQYTLDRGSQLARGAQSLGIGLDNGASDTSNELS